MLMAMTDAARKVLDEAMKLPDDARRELAWKLLDGTPDDEDDFPLDPEEATDTDGDGEGNNAEREEDGEGRHGSGEADGVPHDTRCWTQDHDRVVRHQGWKLQRNGPNDEFVWLFDLESDPTEQKNLADARPDKVAELDALLTAHLAEQVPPRWASRASAPISIDKHVNEPEAPDDEYVYYPN